MTELEFSKTNIDDPLNHDVRIGMFGVKYLYLDENTRVRYGCSFVYFGVTYQLQRHGFFWRSVAWTYPETHGFNAELFTIIKYLFWYEQDREIKINGCKF